MPYLSVLSLNLGALLSILVCNFTSFFCFYYVPPIRPWLQGWNTPSHRSKDSHYSVIRFLVWRILDDTSRLYPLHAHLPQICSHVCFGETINRARNFLHSRRNKLRINQSKSTYQMVTNQGRTNA